MTALDGLRLIEAPQAQSHLVPQAPTTAENVRLHRHLWVVGQVQVPYALEDCPFGHALPVKVLKHTNLTGGDDAHCAGEAWFVASDTIVINGRSGRYGPRNEPQLRAAGLGFKQCGYKVAMIGFDETNLPAAVVVGQEDLEWL